MSDILDRKREIMRILKVIDKYPATNNFKQEMMVFSYVLVCGAIEFMVETAVREWLYKTIRHHDMSSYRGKKYIQNFLDTQLSAHEKNIENFHSSGLDRIREFIKNIVGERARDKFNLLFSATNSSFVQPDIEERLKRITRIRHELAHGQKLPAEIQPNVSELREDFIFVYKHIIRNIQKCLPRV